MAAQGEAPRNQLLASVVEGHSLCETRGLGQRPSFRPRPLALRGTALNTDLQGHNARSPCTVKSRPNHCTCSPFPCPAVVAVKSE